jgi:hypothetical protein
MVRGKFLKLNFANFLGNLEFYERNNSILLKWDTGRYLLRKGLRSRNRIASLSVALLE